MSREIAQAIADQKLNELRKLPYIELKKLLTEGNFATCVTGPDGQEYQMEVDVLLGNGRRGPNILVVASVDGGGVSSFRPLTRTFVITPDGSFVGEGPH